MNIAPSRSGRKAHPRSPHVPGDWRLRSDGRTHRSEHRKQRPASSLVAVAGDYPLHVTLNCPPLTPWRRAYLDLTLKSCGEASHPNPGWRVQFGRHVPIARPSPIPLRSGSNRKPPRRRATAGGADMTTRSACALDAGQSARFARFNSLRSSFSSDLEQPTLHRCPAAPEQPASHCRSGGRARNPSRTSDWCRWLWSGPCLDW